MSIEQWRDGSGDYPECDKSQLTSLDLHFSASEFKPRDRKPASGYSRAGSSRGCSSSGIPLTHFLEVLGRGSAIASLTNAGNSGNISLDIAKGYRY